MIITLAHGIHQDGIEEQHVSLLSGHRFQSTLEQRIQSNAIKAVQLVCDWL